MDDHTISIRKAALSDSLSITNLCIQLGYEVTEDIIIQRLQKITYDDNTVIYVAIQNSVIIGWIQISIRSAIESGELPEITGLVVDESFRGNGVGKKLVAKAEEWAKSLGYKSIKVRTNILRTETHLFYKKIGFEEKKKQTVFQRSLI